MSKENGRRAAISSVTAADAATWTHMPCRHVAPSVHIFRETTMRRPFLSLMCPRFCERSNRGRNLSMSSKKVEKKNEVRRPFAAPRVKQLLILSAANTSVTNLGNFVGFKVS